MKSPSILRHAKGFTLIEMIVALAILAAIMGFGLFLSLDYYKSYIFYYEKDLVISILQKARSQSLANINEKKHGVAFDEANKKYILFEGDSLAASANKIEYEEAKIVTTSGLTEVVFDQLTGKATIVPAGNDLTLSDGVRSVIISINHEGRIYQK